MIGGSSNAGCNVCHFPGKKIGGPVCYNNHRKYLPTNHELRNLTPLSQRQTSMFQYYSNERGSEPTLRTYHEYVQNAHEAEVRGQAVDGVKGLWTLHALPYASLILRIVDPMHTFANIIKDSVNVLSPENNRCESIPNRNAYQQLKIFPHLHPISSNANNNKARWSFTKQEIEEIHDDMKFLPQTSKSLQKPFEKSGGHSSHDKLIWATKFARQVLKRPRRLQQFITPQQMEAMRHRELIIENILSLFDFIGHLCQYKYRITDVDDYFPLLIIILSEHEGLLPPCEATYALHGLVHVLEQIKDAGPPLMGSMFTYEQKNKFIKGLIRNNREPISSIVKNYSISESVTFMICLEFDTWQHFQKLCPQDGDVSPIINAIKKMRYDPNTEKIYCNPEDMEEDGVRMDDIQPELKEYLRGPR
jgi:hypothetical protein